MLDKAGDLSYDILLQFTALYHTSSSEEVDLEDFLKTWTIEIFYFDEKKGWAVVSCDKELAQAFQQAQTNLKKPIRTVRDPFSKRVVAIDDGSRIVVLKCSAVVTKKKQFRSMTSAPGANGYIPSTIRSKNGKEASTRRFTSNISAKRTAKRWTSPPANNHCQILSVLQSLVTLMTTVAVLLHVKFEAAAKSGHRVSEEDREKIRRLVETLNTSTEEKSAVAEQNISSASSKPNKEESEKSAAVAAHDLLAFDQTFIHGRHICDGCHTSPIIGIRYHATHIPDFDLCRNCIEKCSGSGIEFKPQQLGKFAAVFSKIRMV